MQVRPGPVDAPDSRRGKKDEFSPPTTNGLGTRCVMLAGNLGIENYLPEIVFVSTRTAPHEDLALHANARTQQ